MFIGGLLAESKAIQRARTFWVPFLKHKGIIKPYPSVGKNRELYLLDTPVSGPV